jgi:UDPglucose 6-dehydrogenase
MSEAGTIGFAGLSHLGIVYSIAAATRGFSVLAFDERPGIAEELQAGRFPISEPGLEDAFGAHGRRIRYSADVSLLADCSLIFITLDVPTDDANNSNLAPLEALIDRVSAHAAPQAVLVLMSQAPPGFCRRLASRLPSNFRLFYQVETLVFGNAVERAVHPERYMVGCADVATELPELYRQYLETFDCPLLPMRYESAELCKIAINCFLASSVSTTNTLAEICEKIGADWFEIVPALSLDRRIGPHAYLSPGLGIAGGNLERDLATVRGLAAEHGAEAGIVAAWQRNSAYRKDWVLRLLSQEGMLSRGLETQVAIWGLAYKPETHSTKNSPSLALIRALHGYRLRAYDPAVKLDSDAFPDLLRCASALETVQDADVTVIMTPWREFAAAPLAEVKRKMRGRNIVDPFGILNKDICRQLGFDYYCLGVR